MDASIGEAVRLADVQLRSFWQRIRHHRNRRLQNTS
jgi:hypothetical protein